MASNPSLAPFVMALIAAGLIGGALTTGALPSPIEPLRRAPAPPEPPGEPAPVADRGAPKAEPALRDLEAVGEPEPPPAQPEVLGADIDPATPPVLYRGTRKVEGQTEHRWSLGEGEASITLPDPPGMIFGGKDPAALKPGERLAFKGQPGPTIIALGSNQCVPCLKELGDLVRDLGEPLQASKVRVMLVLMTLDGHGYISFQLARQRDLFFGTYNKDYRGDDPVLPIPDWMVFPQDKKDHWFTFTDQLIDAMSGKDLNVTLPVTLLLDACGNVHQSITGRLHGDRLAQLRADAAALAEAGCAP